MPSFVLLDGLNTSIDNLLLVFKDFLVPSIRSRNYNISPIQDEGS